MRGRALQVDADCALAHATCIAYIYIVNTRMCVCAGGSFCARGRACVLYLYAREAVFSFLTMHTTAERRVARNWTRLKNICI